MERPLLWVSDGIWQHPQPSAWRKTRVLLGEYIPKDVYLLIMRCKVTPRWARDKCGAKDCTRYIVIWLQPCTGPVFPHQSVISLCSHSVFSRNPYSHAHHTPYPESCFTDYPTEFLTKSLGGHASFPPQRQEREAGQKVTRAVWLVPRGRVGQRDARWVSAPDEEEGWLIRLLPWKPPALFPSARRMKGCEAGKSLWLTHN